MLTFCSTDFEKNRDFRRPGEGLPGTWDFEVPNWDSPG